MENFDYKKYVWVAGGIALISLAYAAIGTGLSEFKSAKRANGNIAQITITGEGEARAVPDVSKIVVTIREVGKSVPEGQKLVEKKTASLMEKLKSENIDEKDIKTTSYTVNPKYEQATIYCIKYPCPQGKMEVVGYEIAQTIEIKVRNIENTGKVIGDIGSLNITEISGPEFTVDDMDAVTKEAKEEAIKDAKEKARELAKSLGVDLGSISNYSDDSSYTPYPMMYSKDSYSLSSQGGRGDMSVTIPQGETIRKVKVNITYNID